MNNCFDFKFIDLVTGTTKNDKEYYKLIAYCSFGYVVNIFLTRDKYLQLRDILSDSDLDINDYIKVFYDNNKQRFVYIIK